MATMDLVDGDKIHLHFKGNAMEEIRLSEEDQEYVKQFDIVYAERWTGIDRYAEDLKQPGQIWVYDFSKRLELESNDRILPYIDYAFFSYDRDDEYIRSFMVKTRKKCASKNGAVIAMLGEYGSLAFDGMFASSLLSFLFEDLNMAVQFAFSLGIFFLGMGAAFFGASGKISPRVCAEGGSGPHR